MTWHSGRKCPNLRSSVESGQMKDLEVTKRLEYVFEKTSNEKKIVVRS